METVQTDKAPSAVGAYSQGVVAGDFLFVSGQIPLDPETGQLVDGDVAEQTERVLNNVRAVLNARYLDFQNVCKMEIYLDDINNFSEVNEIYGRKLGECRPARQALGVSGLPKGAKVEISCIAHIS